MENNPETNKDYSTISPSAKTLLLLKGVTKIPFAKEAAALMLEPEPFIPDYNRKDFGYWARVIHFESRYLSIDELLKDLPVRNILELSSGFSFRGLATVAQDGYYYIDTDLPEIISQKKHFLTRLQPQEPNPKSKLETLPLNALDEKQFLELTDHFPPGSIAIINEGLLMYLDLEEKRKLCGIIRNVLEKRGGYWITADIYLKTGTPEPAMKMNDELEKFLEQHNIEENKFDNLEAAEEFFKSEGFIIDKEAALDYSKSKLMKYFLASIPPERLTQIQKTGKFHATWRLKLA
jgi:O-methyltransferase involved in polyketide biosynthesis